MASALPTNVCAAAMGLGHGRRKPSARQSGPPPPRRGKTAVVPEPGGDPHPPVKLSWPLGHREDTARTHTVVDYFPRRSVLTRSVPFVVEADGAERCYALARLQTEPGTALT
jgi:hypothetical protein